MLRSTVWIRYTLEGVSYVVSNIFLGMPAIEILSVPGYAATVTTLSYAIRFWSKGTKRALFLRHEGFLYVFFLLRITLSLPDF
jgi:pantothenate kinase